MSTHVNLSVLNTISELFCLADVIMPGACAFYWLNNSSYVAGDQVVAKLFLKDRFNNSVIVTQNELMMLHVTIYRTLTSETMNLIDANILTGIEENAVRLSFLTRQSGNFQLSITDIYGSSISASPYLFSVVPGREINVKIINISVSVLCWHAYVHN
mgnify:FL=1